MTQTFKRIARQQAIDIFRPQMAPSDSPSKNEFEHQLRTDGIATVNLDTPPEAYQELSDQYATCIENYPEWLRWTSGGFDNQGVPEDGHVRKELSMNMAGMQISDPKNLFHFNDSLQRRWSNYNNDRSLHTSTPEEFSDFMNHGFELHVAMGRNALRIMSQLDVSYPGMNKGLYFPSKLAAVTLRLLRYDGYFTHDDSGKLIVEDGVQIAKPHYDRGGATIQAYASAPGFWRQLEGQHGTEYPKFYPPHGIGQSQFFFGAAHRSIYGSKDNLIKPLYHGVDRILSSHNQSDIRQYVEPRTAVIGFIDMAGVDLRITSNDTQPERVDKENLIV